MSNDLLSSVSTIKELEQELKEHATLQDFVARAEADGVKRAAPPATMYFI